MSTQPFIESDSQAPAAQLRARMEQQGYLFFRALLPHEEVLKVRREVLEQCAGAGWLDPAAPLMDGAERPGIEPLFEGDPAYRTVYRRLLKGPLFHAFPTQPVLLLVAGKLLGIQEAEVLVHPRRIGRVTWPHLEAATTPAHQDHFYIRGSLETYSCWVPLGDCPLQLGNLAVLPGSHHGGFRAHDVHLEHAVGGRGVEIDEAKAAWHGGDMSCGDALFFHSLCVHKALPNRTANRLRLSTDNRFQKPGDAIDPAALRPHYDAA